MERCLSSKRLYEGKILNLRVDQVEVSRNGCRATREVIEHRSDVAVLARDVSKDAGILVRLHAKNKDRPVSRSLSYHVL